MILDITFDTDIVVVIDSVDATVNFGTGGGIVVCNVVVVPSRTMETLETAVATAVVSIAVGVAAAVVIVGTTEITDSAVVADVVVVVVVVAAAAAASLSTITDVVTTTAAMTAAGVVVGP